MIKLSEFELATTISALKIDDFTERQLARKIEKYLLKMNVICKTEVV